MDAEFWLERWRDGRTHFHQTRVTPLLQKYWPTLSVPAGGKVLVLSLIHIYATARIFSTEQWLFNGVRDQSYERPFNNPTGAAELAERLADRDKFLASLELTPRNGFEGQWGNYGGQLKVVRQADGSLFAEVSAADVYKRQGEYS